MTVEPHPRTVPPVWVAGGGQLDHAASPEQPVMHPNVLRRIAAAGGWIARPTSPPAMIAADRARIAEARAGAALTVAHENFVWIERAGSPEAVRAAQQRRFGAVLSDRRPWDYIDSVYLPRTIDEIQRKVQARIDRRGLPDAAHPDRRPGATGADRPPPDGAIPFCRSGEKGAAAVIGSPVP